MRLVSGIAIAALVLLLPACELKRPGRAKTPAAPQPAAAKAAPPAEPSPSEPLSVPQTQVHLPPPQPINPEALATPPVNNPSEAAAPRQAHRTPRPKPGSSTTASGTAASAKPETAEAADAPAPTETPRQRIEPVLPEEQRRQLQEDVVSRLKQVDQMLGSITARRLSDAEKGSVESIRSFVALSRKALDRGDTQQASGLADRALVLAQEMVRGR